MTHFSADIANQLTLAAAKAPRTEEAQLMLKAAEELARLRLSAAEREAVCQAVASYEFDDYDEECVAIAATLRGLLERTK